MIIVWNGLAFVWLAAGLAVFWVACWLGDKFDFNSKVAEGAGLLIGIAVTLGLDLLCRWGNHQDEGSERYYAPRMGGSILFLPVWMWAAVGLVAGGSMVLLRR